MHQSLKLSVRRRRSTGNMQLDRKAHQGKDAGLVDRSNYPVNNKQWLLKGLYAQKCLLQERLARYQQLRQGEGTLNVPCPIAPNEVMPENNKKPCSREPQWISHKSWIRKDFCDSNSSITGRRQHNQQKAPVANLEVLGRAKDNKMCL